jgi:hypothetical protein
VPCMTTVFVSSEISGWADAGASCGSSASSRILKRSCVYVLLRVCVDKLLANNCFSPDKSFFAAKKSIILYEAFEGTVNYISNVLFTWII